MLRRLKPQYCCYLFPKHFHLSLSTKLRNSHSRVTAAFTGRSSGDTTGAGIHDRHSSTEQGSQGYFAKMTLGKGNNLTNGTFFELWRQHFFNQQAFMEYLQCTYSTKCWHFYDRKLPSKVVLIKVEGPSTGM